MKNFKTVRTIKREILFTNSDYDNQIKQYERNTRLGIVGTYHIGDNEYTIEELDNLACQKASQIRDLREQIKQIESNE